MAFNFSKIIRNVTSTANSFRVGVDSITRQAQQPTQGLQGLSSSVGNVTSSMQGIRNAVGNDLGTFDLRSQAANFATTGLSNNDVFDPSKLNGLISNVSQVGNVAAAAGQIAQEIQGISNRGTINVNSNLSGLGKITNTFGTIANVTGALSKVSGQFGSTISSIQGKVSALNGFDISSLNNIVGSFGNFDNLVQNVITVVPRELGELIGAVGGEFDRLRQLAESQSDTSGITGDFLDLTFKSPWDSEAVSGAGVAPGRNLGTAASKIPNPLREMISWNYIITLGILNDQEFNFPGTYRNSGDLAEKYIVRSGGGKLDRRYKTYIEGEEDAEYYIDNLEMDAVIAPNSATNVALGTTLSFEVVEPYSMGQFIEAIIGSSADTGASNYTDVPFCLKFEFVGWGEHGEQAVDIGEPIYVPILITKIDFSVTGKGSVYSINAVPMTETGLDDKVQESKTRINTAGQKVSEVLNGDERSVQAVFNERVQELEQSGTVIAEDRYIIAFPKDPADLVNLVNGISNEVAGINQALTVDAPEQQRREKGLASPEIDRSTERRQEGIENNSVNAPSQLFNVLKAYASDTNNMNPIGLSDLVDNTAEPGQQPQAEQQATYNEFGDIVDIGSTEANVSEKGRTYQFQQGEMITDIITKVILQSKWAKERATEDSSNGTRKWFKIDTQVFLDKNPAAEKQRGRTPKIFVYSIIPYYSDEAKFLGASQRPSNTEGLKALAPKEYNYFYTGKNEEVLNFDIAFNNSFFQLAFANYGQNSASIAQASANKSTQQKGDEQKGTRLAVENPQEGQTEPGAQTKETVNLRYTAGSESSDVKQRIAEQFHNTIINSPADMVTAEMEIWGDPFFLPQQTGNFIGDATDNPNVLQQRTMNYLQNEVFAVVNFKTPFDYQIEGATMEFPQTVPQFSGLYSIWSVTNRFAGGQFTQFLKMIRRRGQDDAPTVNKNPIVPDDQTSINESTEQTLGADAATSANNAVNSTAGSTEPCATTAPVNAVQAVSNLTSVAGEDLLMSMPVFNNKSTTAGDDVVFSQPVAQVGDFAWTPNQSIFPSAPKQGTYTDTSSVAGNNPSSDPSFAPISDDGGVIGSKIESDNTFLPKKREETFTKREVKFTRRPPTGDDLYGERKNRDTADRQYSDAYLRRQAKRARERGDSGSSRRGGRRG